MKAGSHQRPARSASVGSVGGGEEICTEGGRRCKWGGRQERRTSACGGRERVVGGGRLRAVAVHGTAAPAPVSVPHHKGWTPADAAWGRGEWTHAPATAQQPCARWGGHSEGVPHGRTPQRPTSLRGRRGRAAAVAAARAGGGVCARRRPRVLARHPFEVRRNCAWRRRGGDRRALVARERHGLARARHGALVRLANGSGKRER